jgi:hypothetical protein
MNKSANVTVELDDDAYAAFKEFLLRKMQDEEQKQGYSAKVKAWLEKPEQADFVKSIKATISPNINPRSRSRRF